MVAGVTEIASRANVSKGLVSRYLNSDPKLKIKPETMVRIDKAKKLFDSNKRSKNSGTSFAGNFVIPISTILHNMSLAEIIQTSGIKPLEQILEKNGFRVSVIFVDDSGKKDAVKRLIESPNFCDGIIFLTDMANAELAELVLGNNMPHVSIDPRDEAFGLNTVLAHSLLGVKQALDHLVLLGHKNIGYIGRKDFYRCSQFFAAMMEMDMQFQHENNIYFLSVDSTAESWRDLAKSSFLEQYDVERGVTAYICQDDEIAFGVIDAMREIGLEPGMDISIIGYDNIEKRRAHYEDEPILTTINNPKSLVGKRCGEILLGQVVQKQMDIMHEYVPAKLIIRKTTGVCLNEEK